MGRLVSNALENQCGELFSAHMDATVSTCSMAGTAGSAQSIFQGRVHPAGIACRPGCSQWRHR